MMISLDERGILVAIHRIRRRRRVSRVAQSRRERGEQKDGRERETREASGGGQVGQERVVRRVLVFAQRAHDLHDCNSDAVSNRHHIARQITQYNSLFIHKFDRLKTVTKHSFEFRIGESNATTSDPD